MLCAVNFSLKHASGSNGLLGAVDHLGELELLGGGVVGEHFYFWVFGWVGSECVFGFCWGSVNEWMRKKKKWIGGGGLCRVGGGFDGLVGGWELIYCKRLITRVGEFRSGLDIVLERFVSGGCYAFFLC